MSRAMRRQLLFLLVFLIVVVFFVTTYRMGVVRGESMMPTYQNGRVALVRRRNAFSGPLRHNDVVLLRKGRDVIIKRIYRLPGEEVNAFPPDEREQAQHPEAIDTPFSDVLRFSRANDLLDYYEQQEVVTPNGVAIRYTVPEGYLVVLGDNRRASEDSRFFGPVPVRDVLGVVVNAPGPPLEAGVPSTPDLQRATGNLSPYEAKRPIVAFPTPVVNTRAAAPRS